MEDMLDRWVKLWERVGAQGNFYNSYSVFDILKWLYSAPDRKYHTLQHVAQCLGEFKDVYDFAGRPNELEMAIWFHDAIYDTHSDDSEERSAGLAYSFSKEIMGLGEPFSRRVYNLILATKHDRIPGDYDAKILVDIDLSNLAVPSKEFDSNTRKIRKEYGWVPEEKFMSGRAEILQKFLDRRSVYLTSYFKRKYEAKARKNLERSIKKLTAGHRS